MREQPQGQRAGGGGVVVGLGARLDSQPLGLGPGRGELLGGRRAVLLGRLGGLGQDLVPLGLGGLEKHADLLARVGDRLPGLPRGVGQPCVGLGQRTRRRVAVGRGLVVEATRLGLEHLGQSGRLGRLLLRLAAQLVGHLLGVQQQLRSRRTVRRLVTGLGVCVWVDRLHSVHQVLVQPTLPPTGSVPRRLATRGAYCANGLGCDPS